MKGLKVQGLRGHAGPWDIGADLEVAPGERLALMGPSGSGKTTVLRWIAGLATPARGSIVLDGVELSRLAPERREVGLVFQEQALLPHLSALDNATLGLRFRGVARPERDRRGQEWLERVGLGGRLAEPVTVLSGGERQRIALVRALIWGPRALLLDEPFTGLDAPLKQELSRWIVELHALHPVPLVLVTHDREEVRSLGARESLVFVEGARRRFGRHGVKEA